MEGWAAVTALTGLGAVGAAIWLGYLNRQLVKATLDLVRVSQEQLENQQRPILVPLGSPVFQAAHDNWLKWDEETQPLTIRNLGAGTAFNVASVLYGCSAYVHDTPTGPRHFANTGRTQWVCWLGVPIASGETETSPHKLGHGTFTEGNNRIGDYMLEAPEESLPGPTMLQGVLWRVARLSITYHDIAGRKHASIFAYVHGRGWHKEAILPNIDRDLHDLEGYYRPVPAINPPVVAEEGSARIGREGLTG